MLFRSGRRTRKPEKIQIRHIHSALSLMPRPNVSSRNPAKASWQACKERLPLDTFLQKLTSRKSLLKSQNDKITLKTGGSQPHLCPDYAREKNGTHLNRKKTPKRAYRIGSQQDNGFLPVGNRKARFFGIFCGRRASCSTTGGETDGVCLTAAVL